MRSERDFLLVFFHFVFPFLFMAFLVALDDPASAVIVFRASGLADRSDASPVLVIDQGFRSSRCWRFVRQVGVRRVNAIFDGGGCAVPPRIRECLCGLLSRGELSFCAMPFPRGAKAPVGEGPPAATAAANFDFVRFHFFLFLSFVLWRRALALLVLTPHMIS